MNLILLKPDDFTAPDKVCLTGRRYRHIKQVLRAGPGAPVTCGVLDGKMGTGIISTMDTARAVMTVTLDQSPPTPLPLNLVLGLPRPKMLKRIIQHVTALGVKHIYLVNSWRVEKSFWQSPVLADEKLEEYKILGLEQAKDTRMPVIYKKRLFTRFVKNELPNLAQNTQRITAHPKADKICPAGLNQPATLAVGPEGGWIVLEAKTLENAGFTNYSIGPRILTVETAVTCLISRLFT